MKECLCAAEKLLFEWKHLKVMRCDNGVNKFIRYIVHIDDGLGETRHLEDGITPYVGKP